MDKKLSKLEICDGCAKDKELFPIAIQGIGMSWQCRECANIFMEFEKRHQQRKKDSLFSDSYKRKYWN